MTAAPIPDLIASLTDEQFAAVVAMLNDANRAAVAAEANLIEARTLLATVRRYNGRAINVLQGAGQVMG